MKERDSFVETLAEEEITLKYLSLYTQVEFSDFQTKSQRN
jgi:hypothetical protein